MEAGIFEPEKDVEKAHFQQELSRWFESRGIITDLRSHLRHLMITALLGTRVGVRQTDGSSPKAQALNLMVAEYLFKHNCHYTLSVFTSEVPTLANFDPGVALREDRHSDAKKKQEGVCFRDNEIEEIFNALGMSSREEELELLKAKYLEKGNETSLVELFLHSVVEMSTKLHIRQNLESLIVENGERLLSKKWSAKITDILLAEKMALPQIAAAEGAILRITEREVKRIMEEKRKSELQTLTNRERRIQEYLRKHEDDILLRLTEAEKDLMTRKGIIDEELTERQRHLMRMAVEWNNKHEEILRLSKNFHKIENENRDLQKKLKDLQEENKMLKTQGEFQSRTIDTLQGETNSLLTKLKEVTDSNAALSERIETLISQENKKVSIRHIEANQKTGKASAEEIPLLWSRNMTSDDLICSDRGSKEESEFRAKPKEFPVKIQTVSPPENCNFESTKSQCQWSDAEPKFLETNSNSLAEEDDSSFSFSSDEIIIEARKKLLNLEEETNRINQNYLEYKLKCISSDSSSESLSNQSHKSAQNISEKAVITKETKFCQTVNDETFVKIQKLKEKKEKSDFNCILKKKLEEVSPIMPAMCIPTTRQQQNRKFFLQSRQLLHELGEKNLEDLQETSPSATESPTLSSGEEFTRSLSKKSKSPKKSILLTPLRTASFYCNDEVEVQRKPMENNKLKSESSPKKLSNIGVEMNAERCLALLEETRIKSPQTSAGKPLRQQILLSESEKEKIFHCNKSDASSAESLFSGKKYGSRKSENGS